MTTRNNRGVKKGTLETPRVLGGTLFYFIFKQ
jgi:hypothetical protein